jgi:hypothetical protein
MRFPSACGTIGIWSPNNNPTTLFQQRMTPFIGLSLAGKDGKKRGRRQMKDRNAIVSKIALSCLSGLEGGPQGRASAASWPAIMKNSFKGADGKLASEKGKYVTVWKKQKDGTWRAIQDIWNSGAK